MNDILINIDAIKTKIDAYRPIDTHLLKQWLRDYFI